MDDAQKSVSVGALAVGDVLFKVPIGAEHLQVDYATGTPKQWFNDARSADPAWLVVCVSALQVLALRIRA